MITRQDQRLRLHTCTRHNWMAQSFPSVSCFLDEPSPGHPLQRGTTDMAHRPHIMDRLEALPQQDIAAHHARGEGTVGVDVARMATRMLHETRTQGRHHLHGDEEGLRHTPDHHPGLLLFEDAAHQLEAHHEARNHAEEGAAQATAQEVATAGAGVEAARAADRGADVLMAVGGE
jgi:hypothetical protein